MAADLSVSVGIEGQQAVTAAKEIGQAMTQMGQAGDQAAQKVAASIPKMTEQMKQASVQAAQTKGMFDQLQASAAKPVAGGGAGGMLELLTALEKARVYYQEIGESAKGLATLGGKQAAGFLETADAVKTMGDALASTRQMVSEMIAGGASMEEIFMALREQVTMLESPMSGASNAAKQMFQSIAAGLEKDVEATARMTKAMGNVEEAFNKEIAAAKKAADEAEKARLKEQAAAEKAAKAELEAKEKEAQQELAIQQRLARQQEMEERRAMNVRRTTMEQMSRSPMGGAASTLMNLMMGGQMLTGGGGMMGAVMGIQQLGTGLGEAAAGATTFGAAFGGIMVLLAGAAAAFVAVKIAIDGLKAGMAAAAEEEKLGVQFKDLLGTTKAAEDQLAQLKNFVTGQFGGFLKLDDVAQGVRQLELLTGQTNITEEQLKAIAGAAAGSGATFTTVAAQYGRIVDSMRLGLPIRAQLLIQMQREGEISAATVSKLETMAKSHASVKDQLAALNAGMIASAQTAENMTNTWEGASQRLKNAFDIDVAAPFGEALLKALTPVANELTKLFTSHATEIQQMADKVEYALLFAFHYVSDNGIVKSMQDALAAVGQYIQDNWKNWIMTAIQQSFDNWKTAWGTLLSWLGDQINFIFNKAGQAAKVLQDYMAGKGAGQVTTAQDVVTQAQEKLNALTLGGASDEQIQKAVAELKAAQEAAAKAMEDAAKKSHDELDKPLPNLIDSAKQWGAAAATAFASNPALQSFMQGYGMMAPSPVSPPFPGASRGLSEWKPGEKETKSVMIGAFGAMGPGDIAISMDKAIQMFGSVAAAGNKFVDILDKDGNILLAHQRIRDISFLKEGVANQNTYEVWGRAWDAWGKLVPSAANLGPMGGRGVSPTETPSERAARETREDMARQAAATPAKPGAAAPIEKPTKDKTALTEEKSLTDQLTEAEKKYGTQIEIVEAKRKAHMISDAQAYQAELGLYKQEEADLQKIKTQLEAAYKAAQDAHNPKLAEQYRMKLDEIDLKLLKITADMQKVGAANSFWGQAAEEANKKSQELSFTGKSMIDDLSQGFSTISSGFMSIIDGSQKASDAFKQMAKSIIDQLWQIGMKLIESQLMKWIGSMMGGATSSLGTLGSSAGTVGDFMSTFQSGGMVGGAPGIDKVPSMLSAGEYVLTKASVDRYGIKLIDAMNKGTWGSQSSWPHFATGGSVGGYSPMNIPPSQSISGTGGVQNVTVATTVNVGSTQTSVSTAGQGGGGGLTKEQISQFQTVINNTIREEIVRQKRPGGILNRNTT